MENQSSGTSVLQTCHPTSENLLFYWWELWDPLNSSLSKLKTSSIFPALHTFLYYSIMFFWSFFTLHQLTVDLCKSHFSPNRFRRCNKVCQKQYTVRPPTLVFSNRLSCVIKGSRPQSAQSSCDLIVFSHHSMSTIFGVIICMYHGAHLLIMLRCRCRPL